MRAAVLYEADAVRPVRIPLSGNDPNAGRSLTRSVDRMLRDGRGRAPVVVELHGSQLPAPLVAALIGNLRRLREAGGELAADPTTPALRRAMALHGLDRVFSGASTTAAARSPRRAGAAAGWPAFALMLLMATIASVILLLQQSAGAGGL